ncbi:MAG: hypothetical protein HXY43_02005 [Fischerella sp.]|uniref:hypothetical protein n=1 Tax=Fischerella sp. TaxID=1191 RepID=UPI00183ED17A|nr:hypothetical protein [Fischerella sp.]NWF58108.1 hypothetical protein [Fischerella sp.]
MICEHGQTQETSRRLNSGDIFDQRERLGSLQASSRSNGTEQIGLDQINCSGQDSTGETRKQGETSTGKILERLEFIENAYISYVEAHQQRLEARLIESKEQKELFKEVVQELKQEIYNLVSEQIKEENLE